MKSTITQTVASLVLGASLILVPTALFAQTTTHSVSKHTSTQTNDNTWAGTWTRSGKNHEPAKLVISDVTNTSFHFDDQATWIDPTNPAGSSIGDLYDIAKIHGKTAVCQGGGGKVIFTKTNSNQIRVNVISPKGKSQSEFLGFGTNVTINGNYVSFVNNKQKVKSKPLKRTSKTLVRSKA